MLKEQQNLTYEFFSLPDLTFKFVEFPTYFFFCPCSIVNAVINVMYIKYLREPLIYSKVWIYTSFVSCYCFLSLLCRKHSVLKQFKLIILQFGRLEVQNESQGLRSRVVRTGFCQEVLGKNLFLAFSIFWRLSSFLGLGP